MLRKIIFSSKSALSLKYHPLALFSKKPFALSPIYSHQFSTEKPKDIPINDEFIPISEELVKKGKEKIVGTWLLLTAGSVVLMILLGGYTRLSKSGLSMTKWKPIAYKYPTNVQEWEVEFENYKKYPEYQISNKGMSVDEFKNIFLIEYVHRYLGQSIGFIFTVPFLSFIGLGYMKPKLTKRCLALLALGGVQGLIGWWMVKSGLKEKPEYQSRPRVSTYRLFVHLNAAIIIYSTLLWNAFNLLRGPQEKIVNNGNLVHMKKMRRGAIFILHFIALNIMSGAFVAGIDAGKVFNTWPLMNGEFIPGKYWDEKYASLANFIENRANVQFNHRIFAYLTYLSTLALWFSCRRLPVPAPARRALNLLFALVNLQVIDGIVTLLYMVPVWFGVVHQAGALAALSSGLYMMHTVRNPSKAFLLKLKKIN